MRVTRRTFLIVPAAVSAAIAVGAVASGCGNEPQAAAANGATPRAAATTAAPAPPTRRMAITIKSDDQHAKKGPGGRYHDAFLPADFTVRPGQEVVMRFRNLDDSPHSFTSPRLGKDALIPGATDGAPGTATVTFTAPAKAGRYSWFCKLPCDPWAMAHDGFMRGYVTVASPGSTG